MEWSASAIVCPWGSKTDGLRVTKTRAFIRSFQLPVSSFQLENGFSDRQWRWTTPAPETGLKTSFQSLRRNRREHPIKNRVDVAQLIVQVERLLDFRWRQDARQIGIGQEERLEVFLFVKRAHGVALDPFIRLLARNSPTCQLQQYGAGKDHAARTIEILFHPLRVDDHAADDPREAAEHVIEGDETVRQNHPLDRRMGDVALVPQRDIFERRHRVAAQQPRQSGDLLAPDRIALVRHRRRALLPFSERLLDLADFCFLQTAN